MKSVQSHLLNDIWILWYNDNNSKKSMVKSENSNSWKSNLQEAYTFSTVEEFWSLFNNIKLPTEIKIDDSYALFKKNSSPIWEDCLDGGKWVFMLTSSKYLNRYWIDMLMCLIGAENNLLNMVNGIYIIIKKEYQYTIQIWIDNINRENDIINIGKIFKNYSNFPNKIYFQPHNKNDKIKLKKIGKISCLYHID
jgi:translation initiation factor 4E